MVDIEVMKHQQQQEQQQQHGDIFTAERLLGKRRKRGQLEYLVQWQGFSNEHNTWEPRENILDPELIRDFNDRMRGSRKSRRSPKSLKHLQQHLSHDKRRYSVETALRRTVDALWHQMTSCDKPRHMSTDSSIDEMTSYYEAGLRGSTGNSSISSSSSSASSSSSVSPIRCQPPTLSVHSGHSECTTLPRHQSHYDLTTHSTPTLHSPALSDASYSSSESLEPMMTSLPVSRQSSLTSLEDVERFVSTPYWRYSPHRMPPKKRWLVSELLNTPVSPVSTVHVCHHSFPICHFTEDKLTRRT